MDTCITVWQWPQEERWYDEGVRQSLRLISDAGFTHINWNPDSGNSYMLSDAEIAFTAEMVHASGLKVKSLHGSNGRNPISEVRWRKDRRIGMETRRDILSPHEWQRKSGVELVRNRIDLACAFGAPDIVMHIDITDEVFRSREVEDAFLPPYGGRLRSFSHIAWKRRSRLRSKLCFAHRLRASCSFTSGFLRALRLSSLASASIQVIGK